ncbi:glucose 1-dehydrogenase [Pseudarthrobacter sulfonivorans]|uniref:SDR family NAD(P)-dependent oxidoreductase n=1 Tax=Pseudarthrobacter sulfonivorans TaxID=121292 RepID=UPI00168B6CE6|nr:SDR family oxidoreductase [Pseudarthrobacter sulfonivorans]
MEHIVITGAANGLGLQAAIRFAEKGSAITMVDFNGDRLAEGAEQVRRAGAAKVNTIIADLRNADAPGEVIAEAWAFAPIDVLVNSAGIYPSAPMLELTAARWDDVQNINVRAPMLASVALAHRTIAEGRPAAIVNISSTVILRTRPGAAAYSASKSAVEMLTRSAALELGEYGIRVNAVAPGFVAVDSPINPVTDEYSAAVSMNPLGHPGTPDDIAAAIVWLAGPEASWVTGSVLRVDGGSSTGSRATPLSWGTTSLPDDAPVG